MSAKPNRLSWITRIYIPMILKGMLITLREFFRKPVTIQYPEHKPKISERFRGEHRLTKDEQGHMKCVACYMCATACPAHCINIEAEAAPPDWEGRDKINAQTKGEQRDAVEGERDAVAGGDGHRRTSPSSSVGGSSRCSRTMVD